MPLARPDREPSPLRRHLARQIVEMARADGLRPGDMLNQLALSERLGVSRTPVRGALALLAELGAVEVQPRGVTLRDASVSLPNEPGDDAIAELITKLARDRMRVGSAEAVTEAELMRRHGASRADIGEALRRLSELGIAMRKPGFGWRFAPEAVSREERYASFRFRLAIEPAALEEPDYRADPAWLARMRGAHERYLTQRWRDGMAVDFFEMNASFHLGLVTFSGNRFLIQATEQQNALRRLRNYSWTLGEARVHVSCREHLAIIGALECEDRAGAIALLRAHLEATGRLFARRSDGPDPGRP